MRIIQIADEETRLAVYEEVAVLGEFHPCAFRHHEHGIIIRKRCAACKQKAGGNSESLAAHIANLHQRTVTRRPRIRTTILPDAAVEESTTVKTPSSSSIETE